LCYVVEERKRCGEDDEFTVSFARNENQMKGEFGDWFIGLLDCTP
jgi:hypothetical protein